jgi:predicted anti-sigma-YlaC factor YlaD
MECTAIQDWLFRKMDGELSDRENEDLNAHLAQCAACTREYNLLRLPYRMSLMAPEFKSSEYFSRKLSAHIAGEAGSGAFWLAILRPARRMVPALAGITLFLLTILAYLQLQTPNTELYSAYDKMFIAEQQPRPMLSAVDISDESVLSAIAEWELNHRNTD